MARAPSPRHRSLMGSALLAACLLSTSSAHAELDRRSLILLGRSVLRVEAEGEGGRLQLGSGVVIGKERVVTNCHVTRNASSISVVQAGSRWTVQAQSMDAERDLCILQVPGLPSTPVALGRAASLREGQELAALGYTGGPALQISGGSVVALHHLNGQLLIQCSNGFTSGASGGGLFDRDGRLVGILTFRLPGGRTHYYAVPAEWLLDTLEQRLRFAEVRPHGGLGFWERPMAAQPLFLQAASLERAGQWQALLQLAERWMREDAADPEPLYLRALAQERLGRDAAAVQSWRRSLDVDPGYSRSWAGLAQLYHRTGQAAQAQQAIETLTALNPGLALEVSDRLRADPAEPQDSSHP
ncbi:trypsin-like peptidase domain-containing protein [Azohydromonas lata]|uniref:Trypsin-like peptidase domain-containing protein n=1 Tax=Azohydromonas lata TaxID=45677 RepID=A0ABU5IGQ8_9BURK|nr:trypsin-like peptidase domain-containing protein [Azohydromonas lata]MDZ5458254.1 trypsin-like peptidase domain-containing protein [Azohydromonas lata]